MKQHVQCVLRILELGGDALKSAPYPVFFYFQLFTSIFNLFKWRKHDLIDTGLEQLRS